MSLFRVGLSALRGVRRQSTLNVNTAKVEKFNLRKERYNCEDNNPIHIKGGSLDRVLFGLTSGLCIIGVAIDLKIGYDFAQK